MSEIVVAGAGLAGLVTARHLADAGHDVTVFERASTVGGRVRSAHEDGYTFDRGFQVMFTGYPAVQRELDLDALDLRPFSPGATIARPNSRAVLSDPFGDPKAAVETLLNREVRTADKLRLFALQRELKSADADALLDPSGPDQTIEQYLADYGFSQAFVDRFAAPFYGGITLDRSLSTDARVFKYTFKMLAEGETVVPAGGMGAITGQLAARAREAGATIETDSHVESVADDGEGATVDVDGETVEADAVVVATDPKTARELTGVETIPTEPKACVTQYYTLPTYTELDTGRKLLLNAADDRPNQVAPLSAVAAEYAPAGEQLLSATYLGSQEASDEELASQTRQTLSQWYPERNVADMALVHTDRIEFAQYGQPPGFRSSLPAVDDPDGQVYLAGDFTRWCAIQGAMRSGRDAAEAVAGSL